MSWLRLDFCCRLVLLGGVFLGNRFRSPLEVLFTELEFRHAVLTIHAAPLGFEHYVRRQSVSLGLENNAKTPKNSLVDYDFRMTGDLHVGRYRIDPGEEVHLNKVDPTAPPALRVKVRTSVRSPRNSTRG